MTLTFAEFKELKSEMNDLENMRDTEQRWARFCFEKWSRAEMEHGSGSLDYDDKFDIFLTGPAELV